jgi:hypothetical protein
MKRMTFLLLGLFVARGAVAEDKVVQSKLDKGIKTQTQYEKAVNDNDSDDCGAPIYSASSMLKPDGKASYEAKNLNDAKLSTAWCEGVDGPGVGESITIKLDGQQSHPIWQGRLAIMNGYSSGEKVWKKNGRIKSLKVSIDDKPVATVHLADAMGQQSIDLTKIVPDGLIKRDSAIKLEIAEVYTAGTKDQDTCVSELRVSGCVP